MLPLDKNVLDDSIEHLESYLTTQKELIRIAVAEKSSLMIASMVNLVLIIGLFLLFFLFLSIGCAFLIGIYLGQTYLGFMCIGAFYLVIAILFIAFRQSLIIKPITNLMIRNFFKEND